MGQKQGHSGQLMMGRTGTELLQLPTPTKETGIYDTITNYPIATLEFSTLQITTKGTAG